MADRDHVLSCTGATGMHGGGVGSGGEPGNRNALKHCAYSAEAVRERRELRASIKDIKATIDALS
jgi:hypothetical protein